MEINENNAVAIATITKALSEPFDSSEVKWKPQAVKGDRALAICYIDARCVMDRLDEVVGVDGWQDEYELLPDGSVFCRLKARIGDQWLTKADVGSMSEQPDGGDRMKAAFSDALKRAAVKFGIGRYLYRLGHQWVAYDSQKKKFVETPNLPAWAIPKGGKPTEPKAAKPDAELEKHRKAIRGATTVEALVAAWNTTPADYKSRLVKDKDDRKAQLSKPATAGK